MYELAQMELLPTPTKSHYTFNLRDVSKVFQVRFSVCVRLTTSVLHSGALPVWHSSCIQLHCMRYSSPHCYVDRRV